jgi:K+-sensing histidine kinase KdpD
MKNIMVCVTQQRTCDRLIKCGHDALGDREGKLFIIHVAPKDVKLLGSSREGEALDYLYGKAIEYGANLTVVRSNNILDTLVDLVQKNQISEVILGESNQAGHNENLVTKFKEMISQQAQLTIVPVAQK